MTIDETVTMYCKSDYNVQVVSVYFLAILFSLFGFLGPQKLLNNLSFQLFDLERHLMKVILETRRAN